MVTYFPDELILECWSPLFQAAVGDKFLSASRTDRLLMLVILMMMASTVCGSLTM